MLQHYQSRITRIPVNSIIFIQSHELRHNEVRLYYSKAFLFVDRGRFTGAKVEVSDYTACNSGKTCYVQKGDPDTTITISCSAIGQFVIICHSGEAAHALSLCEVNVFGEKLYF